KTTYSSQITVLQPPAIISAAAATFVVGQGGSFTVRATGYPVSITAGGLPPGLTLIDNHNGTAPIIGVPSAANWQGTPYSVTISATNLTTLAAFTQKFKVTVNQAPAINVSGNTALTVGNLIVPVVITTTGFPKPILTVTGALPPGLTMANVGGTITI